MQGEKICVMNNKNTLYRNVAAGGASRGRPMAWFRFFVFQILMSTCLLGCENGAGSFEDWYEAEGIVAGEETHFETWKGVLALLGDGTLCTAALIDEHVLLTAAHCVYEPSKGVNYLTRPELLLVRGGAEILGPGKNTYATGEEIVLHETWKGDIKDMDSVDLALIRLSRPLTGLEIYPIREAASPRIGQKGKIVGYGLVGENGANSAGAHRQGDTTVLELYKNRIEMGEPSGVCNGDSGGPLFTVQDGQWVITGVTSFGMNEICQASQGGWAVDVVPYRSWIDSALYDLTGHGLEERETSILGGTGAAGASGAAGYDEEAWGDEGFEGEIRSRRLSQEQIACSLARVAPAASSSLLDLALLLW